MASTSRRFFVMRSSAVFVACMLVAAPTMEGGGIGAARFKELVKHAERVCGSPFRPMPGIVFLGDREFDRRYAASIVKRTFAPSLVKRASRSVTAFVPPASNTICFRESRGGILELSLVASEIPKFEDVFIVHELVHVWQNQNIGRHGGAEGMGNLVRWALMEGHAEFLTARYCAATGRTELLKRLRIGRFGKGASASNIAASDRYFLYEESARFFETLAAQKPSLGLWDILKDPPTERQIVYPREYLQGVRKAVQDLAGWRTTLEKWRRKGERRSGVARVGFVALRNFVWEATRSKTKRKKILDEFSNGARLTNSSLRATVLAFQVEESAALCFKIVLSSHGVVAAAKPALHRAADGSSIVHTSFTKQVPGRKDHALVTLIQHRGTVVEVAWKNPPMDKRGTRSLCKRLLEDYSSAERVK